MCVLYSKENAFVVIKDKATRDNDILVAKYNRNCNASRKNGGKNRKKENRHLYGCALAPALLLASCVIKFINLLPFFAWEIFTFFTSLYHVHLSFLCIYLCIKDVTKQIHRAEIVSWTSWNLWSNPVELYKQHFSHTFSPTFFSTDRSFDNIQTFFVRSLLIERRKSRFKKHVFQWDVSPMVFLPLARLNLPPVVNSPASRFVEEKEKDFSPCRLADKITKLSFFSAWIFSLVSFVEGYKHDGL